MERNFCVYRHTSPDGKVYIGITCRKPEVRWKQGKGYEVGTYFRNAIDKYGWESFSHEILETGLTENEASLLEQFYIGLYRATDENYGYNLKDGGYIGGRFTDRVKKKISAKNRAFWENNPEKRKEISARMSGKRKSDEARRRMSISKTGSHPVRTSLHNDKISKGIKAYYDSHKEAAKKQGDRIVGYSLAKRQAIVQLREDGSFVEMYESLHSAERATGIRNGNISRCCHGKIKLAGGYKWQFAIDYNSGREIAQ